MPCSSRRVPAVRRASCTRVSRTPADLRGLRQSSQSSRESIGLPVGPGPLSHRGREPASQGDLGSSPGGRGAGRAVRDLPQPRGRRTGRRGARAARRPLAGPHQRLGFLARGQARRTRRAAQGQADTAPLPAAHQERAAAHQRPARARRGDARAHCAPAALLRPIRAWTPSRIASTPNRNSSRSSKPDGLPPRSADQASRCSRG